VLCWGGNNRGQLGDGSQISRNVPTVVGRARPAGSEDVDHFRTGAHIDSDPAVQHFRQHAVTASSSAR
jgi:hypothetical protein